MRGLLTFAVLSAAYAWHVAPPLQLNFKLGLQTGRGSSCSSAGALHRQRLTPIAPATTAPGAPRGLLPLLSTASSAADNVQGAPASWVKSNSLALKKLAVWAGFLALCSQLRPFFGVVFGTFVLSYVGDSAVRWSMRTGNALLARSSLPVKRLPRRLYALLYIVALLALISSTTILTVPRLNVESQFLAQLGESDNPYSLLVDWLRLNVGPDILNRLEPFLLSITGEQGRLAAGYEANYRDVIATRLSSIKAPWTAERSAKFAKLLQASLSGYLRTALATCREVVAQLTRVLYKAVLSLLFSFMIVWDLPRLKRGITALRDSRLAFAYEVVAPQVQAFASLVGQSFEVQLLIALCNTVLTTAGLLALGISGAWVLAFMVFVCSFVPVAGVFLSTLPMAVAALSEYGVSKVFSVVGMVLGVHAVEAYVLNPQIYSAKLKLHPLFVLCVLYVTEHAVGVQGLILAVPVAVYLINVILGTNTVTGGAAGKGAAALSEKEQLEE